MAISFACTCGKHLRARDQFAGRKIRCPACQSVVTIPGALATGTAASEHPSSVPLAIPNEDDLEPLPAPKPVGLKLPDAVIPLSRPRNDTEVIPPSPTAIRGVSVHNPWVDRSLEQTATPWLPEDRERFGVAAEPRRGGHLPLLMTALLIVIILAGFAFLA